MKKINSYQENKSYDLNKNDDFIYIKYYKLKTHILKKGIAPKYKI